MKNYKNIRKAAIFVGLVSLTFSLVACGPSARVVHVQGRVAVVPASHVTGAVVVAPPAGFVTVKVGKIRYGYHSGVYYRPIKNGYRVVVGPPGAVIRTLPRGYKIVKVRGRKYYSYRGTYYRYDSGHRAYIVVRL